MCGVKKNVYLLFLLCILLCMPGTWCIHAWSAYDNQLKSAAQSCRSSLSKVFATRNSLYLTWLLSETLKLRPMWLNVQIWACLTWHMGGGPRVVVSTAAFHARVRGFGSWSRRFERNKKCFSPIHVWKSAPVTERWRARPQNARAQISHPVNGGQCHLNHLTILRRFSWPSLAYLCTKVA